MTDDEQSSVADDAVSNRSDDTAIDEGEGTRANGQELSGEEHPAQTLAGEHAEPNVESADESQDAEEASEAEIAAAEAAQAAVAPKGPTRVASAIAACTAVVDLPVPPFSLAKTMKCGWAMFPTPLALFPRGSKNRAPVNGLPKGLNPCK